MWWSRLLLRSLNQCFCSMKRAYILIAEGFECVEALSSIDVLHRAGVELKRVAVGDSLDVVSSHGIMSLHCDMLLEDNMLEDGDALILPGGYPGFVNLGNSETVCRLVRSYHERGCLVAAICGAPTVLAVAGVAEGYRVTCHRSVVDEMAAYNYDAEGVIEDRNIITGAGAGRSIEFALAIAARLVDADTLHSVRQGMELCE